MAMRTRAVAVTVAVLLLLSGAMTWPTLTLRAPTPASPADIEAAPLPLAVVNLQEVLTAVADLTAEVIPGN